MKTIRYVPLNMLAILFLSKSMHQDYILIQKPSSTPDVAIHIQSVTKFCWLPHRASRVVVKNIGYSDQLSLFESWFSHLLVLYAGNLYNLPVPQFPQSQNGNDITSGNKSYSIYFGNWVNAYKTVRIMPRTL